MLRFIKLTILSLICMMGPVTSAMTETEIDYIQVAEDMEIMARIIDKTLEGKFPDEYKALRAFSPFDESRGCQGIYLKGYGAVFMTNINFPVAERAKPQEEATPDDLWQRTRYELRGASFGGVTSVAFAHSAGKDYDPKKVERLREELLRLIGTYAPNIRQLGPQESVVIAVRGMGRTQVDAFQFSVPAVELHREPLREQLKGELQQGLSEPASGTPTPPETEMYALEKVRIAEPGKDFVWSTSDKQFFKVNVPDKGVSGRTTLIIKVNKGSITAYKDGKLDFDGFMKQAEITQY